MKNSEEPKTTLSHGSFSNSFMPQNQLIDSLTSHISLYNSRSLSSNPNPNPRSAILRWFSSLTVHQRQAHLTVVDSKLVRILLQMLGKVRTKGHGCFIILTDLPSGDLPSLCYKKSRGLISRVAESNESERWIFESLRLFGSREGERIEDCSCSANCLDSITVSEDFVENVNRFVDTMDNVSNGSFLRGEESDLGSEWVELDWLKARGFYSMEAFIANRLEVSLRIAWLNCHGGKRRGVKLKEKLVASGMASNVYWRKKACADWWRNLDGATRKKVWTTLLGKAAKSLIHDVLRGADNASEDERWLFGFGGGSAKERYNETSQTMALAFSEKGEFGMGINSLSSKPSTLANILKGLCLLHDMIALIQSCQNGESAIQNLFFSSLGSLSTTVDCVLRKVRGLLMVISVESTKIELLEETDHKFSPKTTEEKYGSTSRKKKAKPRNVKKPNPVSKSCLDQNVSEKTVELRSGLECNKSRDLLESNQTPRTSHVDNDDAEAASAVKMENVRSLVTGKGRATGKKSRKEKNKKNLSSKIPAERNVSVVQNVPKINSSSSEILESDPGVCSSTNQLSMEDIDVAAIGEESLVCSVGRSGAVGTAYNPHVNGTVEVQSSRGKAVNLNVEENVILSTMTTLKHAGSSTIEDVNFRDCRQINEYEEISGTPNGQPRTSEKCESVVTPEHKKGESYDAASATTLEFFSYEWPAVAPVYFPSINSHLPTATDRLHLDIGHSLHAYVRQPFASTVHDARNPSVEGGCKQVLPRLLPMSLDWPPMVRSNFGLTAPLTCNYESRSFMDFPEPKNAQELGNECENNWMSDEEFKTHSGMDYNQYFGGGVMYWNPSDHLGTGFSRPPSLSSDDSSWAWHEAEMKSAVDDMVAFSSSYSTNGLASPTAASFCSPFDPLGPGNQTLGYVVPGNEVSSKVLQASGTTAEAAGEEDASGSLASLSGDVEGTSGDALSYPILRPIIIPNMSRERSRSEFKRGYDLKSPHVPPTRREQPRIKRPPSPVVLCVPRAPRPPPPSPVSESRTRRGFPIVRSGSSSPRHWGVRGWFHDGINWEETCGAEVVWPWRNKNLSVRPVIQPLPAALLQDHLIAMSQLARDQEHPDVGFPLQPPELLNSPTRRESLSLMHNLLNDEIDSFCKQVAAENMAHKPYISWAVKRVTRSLQVLWPRSRTNIFGSNATGLSLPSSDVDLVVCLPPVRNLEPIKEAGILEGRNGIKETCLQHAARYLANQEWVKSDSLKTVENTAIPIIMLVVEVPCDLVSSSASNEQSPKEDSVIVDHGNNGHADMVGFEDSASPNCPQTNYGSLTNVKLVRLDISFKTPSHTGLQTTELVKGLTDQFPAATPLALVLKQFLADRSLDQSYSGGLSSYCLVLLVTRFLQHEHHLGRPINQNFGGLLMDFLYFFGNVFDPRQIRISVQGSGVYRNRERGHSIDPIHIDDPLFPTNNVGRNCFRIHQCIKAFSDAYSILENELTFFPSSNDSCVKPSYNLLPKIIPSISLS